MASDPSPRLEPDPCGRARAAVADLCCVLNALLADLHLLSIKTRGLRWSLKGKAVEWRCAVLESQSRQLQADIDALGLRVRRLGGAALDSLAAVSRLARLADAPAAGWQGSADQVAGLLADNRRFRLSLIEAHDACEVHGDLPTARLLVGLVDEAEERIWRLWGWADATTASGAT